MEKAIASRNYLHLTAGQRFPDFYVRDPKEANDVTRDCTMEKAIASDTTNELIITQFLKP
jgi:hypothetical protein